MRADAVQTWRFWESLRRTQCSLCDMQIAPSRITLTPDSYSTRPTATRFPRTPGPQFQDSIQAAVAVPKFPLRSK
jgi:hypothetical protein